MSIREEFEAWYKREIFPYELFTKDRSGNYRRIACQGHWRAWQASRQALVVKFPEEEPGHLINTTDMIKALEDAGVRFE